MVDRWGKDYSLSVYNSDRDKTTKVRSTTRRFQKYREGLNSKREQRELPSLGYNTDYGRMANNLQSSRAEWI